MSDDTPDAVLRSALQRLVDAEREVRAVLDAEEPGPRGPVVKARDAYAAYRRAGGRTFNEIGEELGVSAGRVRQLVAKVERQFAGYAKQGWPTGASAPRVSVPEPPHVQALRKRVEKAERRAAEAERTANGMKPALEAARAELRDRPVRLVDKGQSEAYTALEHEYMERVGALRAEIQELKDRVGE